MNGRVFIPRMSENIFMFLELLKDYLVGFQEFHRSSSGNTMVGKGRKSANLEVGVGGLAQGLPSRYSHSVLFIIIIFTF